MSAHQISCQRSRLLGLALGRALALRGALALRRRGRLASRGLARRGTARERAAVGLGHALLHLHLHLVLLGLGHHLRGLLLEHVAATGSAWGEEILEDFRDFLARFWLVKPKASEINSLLDMIREAA